MHLDSRCILVDDDATDEDAMDEDVTDEDRTDEDATDKDATDEDAMHVIWSGHMLSENMWFKTS